YRLAVKPLTRAPRDLIKWLETWEQAISTAQRKGVPEALSTRSWFNDFTDAVKPIMDHWVTPYRLFKEKKGKQLTLNYLEVANDFREEVRQARRIVARGAFGPSFAGKEAARQEDAFDDDVESGSDEGERNTGRKRKWDNSPSGRAAKRIECICPACGLFHRLSRCGYIFPEKAPEGFEERDHIRARVNKALEDPKLKMKKLRIPTGITHNHVREWNTQPCTRMEHITMYESGTYNHIAKIWTIKARPYPSKGRLGSEGVCQMEQGGRCWN
ncbi:hypothetical protein B0T25DRAFT_614395, partial [Lasiosphaeria hispida]